MTAIRIVILCLSAALVCSTLRTQHPEMAMVLSMAAGLTALLLSSETLGVISGSIKSLAALAALDGDGMIVIRAAGISIISELGVQICADAGESALGGRIRLGTRIVILGMTVPMISRITESVELLLHSLPS